LDNTKDNQTYIDLKIFEGDSEKVEECKELGKFQIPITPGPKDTVEVDMTITADESGTISAKAVELKTGREEQATFQRV